MSSLSFSLLLISLCCLLGLSLSQGTTPYLEQVFVGKCYEKNPSGVNCTRAWDLFSTAASINTALVNDTDYAPFFAMSNFSTPRSGILFWSGNQAFALAISNTGGHYTTVEGTSTGYILNGLYWCGTVDNTFDYTGTCYFPQNSTYYGLQGVWDQCSHHFAIGAAGDITILLQPSQLYFGSGPYLAYRNTSTFARVELPSMIPAQITSITVLLLTNKTRAPGEFCGNGSLVNLTDTITAKFGYAPKCIDDPRVIYEILCPDGAVNTPECLAAAMAYSDTDSEHPTKENDYLIWALVMTVTSAALLVLTTFFAIRTRILQRSAYSQLGR